METLYDNNYRETEEKKNSYSFRTVSIPEYGGYVLTNRFKYNLDYIKDAYFNINKANHLFNYMVRIPNYQGYVLKIIKFIGFS